MKMKREVFIVMYIFITYTFMSMISITVQARESKRRSKEKSGGFLKNICDVTDRDSHIHCYCENLKEQQNVTKAECWVFKGGIPRDDLIWQSFNSQPALQTLSFNIRVDGALGYVPTKALIYLPNLRSINIKYGNITDVTPFALANLTNIKEVILSQNQIESLQKYAFAHLQNLTTLNLEDNIIIDIASESFYDVPKLQKLILTKNNLTTIQDGVFQYTFNLLELYLNKNNLYSLNRHTFDGLANLKKLDLRKNYIYNLTEYTFQELWNLQELLLGKNELKFVSERAFDGLSQLRKLSLDDNKLTALPAGLFEGVRGLTSLDLRSNKLHMLTYDNIKPILDNLKPPNSNLLLEGNNFACDCKLKWIHVLRNETKSPSTKQSLENSTCEVDTPVYNLPYNKLDEEVNELKYSQEILHAGITIQTLNSMDNVTDKEMNPAELNVISRVDSEISKKAIKRNILNIPPETLPCPKDIKTTTLPPFVINPVEPVHDEMMKFSYDEANHANSGFFNLSSVIICYTAFFFFIRN